MQKTFVHNLKLGRPERSYQIQFNNTCNGYDGCGYDFPILFIVVIAC